jgi:hypothetical protein
VASVGCAAAQLNWVLDSPYATATPRVAEQLMEHPKPINDQRPGFLAAAREMLGQLDVVIGILLAVMLLPLVLGPIIAVYQFVQAGQYAGAAALAALTAACYLVAGRAVVRGEFGPGTAFTVLAGAAIILFAFLRLRR